MQKIVGGWTEVVYPYQEKVCLVCNDESSINGMPCNRLAGNVEKSEMLSEKEVAKVFAAPARKYVTREEQLSQNVYTFNRKTKSIEQIKYAVLKPMLTT